MAPCTYIELALGATLGGRTHFGSLEFTNANGPTVAFSLLPSQALCSEDLDFIADHLRQLCLSEGDTVPPHPPTHNHGLAHAGLAIVDPDVLACRIDAYLGVNPEPVLG